MSILSFRSHRSFSEVQSIFQITPILFRSPACLLDCTVPCQKSSLSYIIPILFRSPVRLLYYTVPCQKSIRLLDYTDAFQKTSPSFRLYRSMSEVQSAFYIIPILFRSPFCLLDYTDPF
jgi:high-affinity nickel permease